MSNLLDRQRSFTIFKFFQASAAVLPAVSLPLVDEGAFELQSKDVFHDDVMASSSLSSFKKPPRNSKFDIRQETRLLMSATRQAIFATKNGVTNHSGLLGKRVLREFMESRIRGQKLSPKFDPNLDNEIMNVAWTEIIKKGIHTALFRQLHTELLSSDSFAVVFFSLLNEFYPGANMSDLFNSLLVSRVQAAVGKEIYKVKNSLEGRDVSVTKQLLEKNILTGREFDKMKASAPNDPVLQEMVAQHEKKRYQLMTAQEAFRFAVNGEYSIFKRWVIHNKDEFDWPTIEKQLESLGKTQAQHFPAVVHMILKYGQKTQERSYVQ